jgi:hypothetical protein
MLETETLDERINKGLALLAANGVRLSDIQAILMDPDTDMTNEYRCLLSKLYGNYFNGLCELGIPMGSFYGFDLAGDDEIEYEELLNRWRAKVNAFYGPSYLC